MRPRPDPSRPLPVDDLALESSATSERRRLHGKPFSAALLVAVHPCEIHVFRGVRLQSTESADVEGEEGVEEYARYSQAVSLL